MSIECGGNQRHGIALGDLSLHIVVAGKRFDEEQAAVNQLFIVVVLNQDIDHKLKATQLNDALAKLVSNRQTRQSW